MSLAQAKEHLFKNQYAVIGPPGTGKTTFVARQVKHAVEAHGEASVMICSLTKTAAREAAGRVELPDNQVGTLHSFCYHALGRPDIAESKVKDWNETHKGLEISASTKQSVDDMGDQGAAKGEGDELLNDMNLRRQWMQPMTSWPTKTLAFAQEWNAWKRDLGLLDYTDLIEQAPSLPPGMPKIIFMDEAQDASRLELTRLIQWGRAAEQVITVGDPYQALYTWRGADPDAMFPADLPQDRVRVLSQSYRIPGEVHRAAMAWIKRMPGYYPIDYEPRDEDGEVNYLPVGFRQMQHILPHIEDDIAAGRTVMIQASCSYMLNHVVSALKEAGIPFHNPWRKQNGAWNPLGARKGTSMIDRLAAFTRPDMDIWGDDADFWSAHDMRAWVDVLASKGILKRGAKKQILALTEDTDANYIAHKMPEWFEEEALKRVVDMDSDWWYASVTETKRKALTFPYNVFKQHGMAKLMESPQVIVGTIHSLKGAEADSVYLFPDLSPAGYREWTGNAQEQAKVYKGFYVGYTRARERLTVCAPSTGLYVNLET